MIGSIVCMCLPVVPCSQSTWLATWFNIAFPHCMLHGFPIAHSWLGLLAFSLHYTYMDDVSTYSAPLLHAWSTPRPMSQQLLSIVSQLLHIYLSTTPDVSNTVDSYMYPISCGVPLETAAAFQIENIYLFRSVRLWRYIVRICHRAATDELNRGFVTIPAWADNYKFGVCTSVSVEAVKLNQTRQAASRSSCRVFHCMNQKEVGLMRVCAQASVGHASCVSAVWHGNAALLNCSAYQFSASCERHEWITWLTTQILHGEYYLCNRSWYMLYRKQRLHESSDGVQLTIFRDVSLARYESHMHPPLLAWIKFKSRWRGLGKF